MAEGAAQPHDGDFVVPRRNGENGDRGGSRGPPKAPEKKATASMGDDIREALRLEGCKILPKQLNLLNH